MSGIDIKPDAQGKVRDIYDLGDKLLMVATDRISAFDYILEDEIPHKGAVLTQISLFWLEQLKDVIGNHLISADVADLPEQFKPYADYLRGRFMLVKKAEMFPVECIVRGYLAGSGLKEYQKQGTVCGIQLPEGLVNSSKLPEPIFTPSTKAEIGDHDENISFERCAEILGEDAATQLRDLAIKVYSVASRPRRRERHHHRRHEVRVRRYRRPASSWPTRCSRPTPAASGRATPTSRAATRPASTSSTCATGSTPTGTVRATRRICPRRSSSAPARSTSRRTRRSPARSSSSSPGPGRAA